MAKGQVTTDHDFIRAWVEERGGKPAAVRDTARGGDDPGIIRVDFPGYSGEGSLEGITWEKWFQKFDESGLAFLYQEETSGGQKSNFNKLVKRDTAGEKKAAAPRPRAARGGKASRKPSPQARKEAFRLLEQQHRDVLQTFAALERGGGDRPRLLADLRELLLAHMTVEERLLYPAARAAGLEAQAFEAIAEHRAARLVLDDLAAAGDREGPQLEGTLRALQGLIESHVQEEEKRLFPQLGKALDASKLESLMGQLEAAAGRVVSGEERPAEEAPLH